jgi:predicted transcriptional regulator
VTKPRSLPPTDDTSATGAMHLPDTLRLSAQGVAKVLGDLETRVLRSVWALGAPATAKAVHADVARSHDVQLHTVITVLNKLVDKGVLLREKIDAVFHYSSTVSEADFLARMSRRAVEGVLSLGPDLVATSFVDVLAEHDPERLEALSQLIQQRLREQHDASIGK